ncbi:FHA domain-containing protein [uncultured Methylobacterium sp.]|uniref:FHA domain-containing protein n=1 Tax=uncultured Methylobacterium sp. TaxID=157278 RepID=UPI0035CA0315
MTETRPSDLVILKIFSGVQAGVEVSLVAGEYNLGSGAEDDIQLVDVSLKASHARLRVAPGKIEIAGSAGNLRTAAGVTAGPDDPWREIEPLDIVTVGTTRFALGYPTSQWATIAEAELDQSARPAPVPPRGLAARFTPERLRNLAAPMIALLLLLVGMGWYVLDGGLRRSGQMAASGGQDLSVVRETLDRFPFGRPVTAHQEVDGAIYVNGYVESPVERRALAAALEQTGVPIRVRLWVLQTLRSEVQNLIEVQKVNVTHELAANGNLTLEGTILNAARAERFVELVKDRVLGVAGIDARIKTAATLLGEVEKLAVTTQIQPWILLRADGDLIEANGAIPVAKIDAWVGFLQSYARRFSKDIALRSFVQLQTPGDRGGAVPERAIVIGAQTSGGDAALNLDRLRQGSFQLDEVFAGAAQRLNGEIGRRPDTAGPAAGAGADGAAAFEPGGSGGPGNAIVRDGRAVGGPIRGNGAESPAGPGASGASNRRPSEAGPAAGAGTDRAAAFEPGGSGGSGNAIVRDGRAGGGPVRGNGAESPAGPGASGAGRRASEAGPAAGAGKGLDSPRLPGTAGRGSPAWDRDAGAQGEGGAPPRQGEVNRATNLLLDAIGGDRRPVAPDRSGTAARFSADARGEGGFAAGGAETKGLPAGAGGTSDLAAGASASDTASADLADQGRDLLERWRTGNLGTDARGRALRIAMETLRAGGDGAGGDGAGAQDGVPSWYLPLLEPREAKATAPCWPDAQLRPADIPATLFWLDILSTSEGTSLATFGRDVQVLLLEAGLNPNRVGACAKQAVPASEAAAHSLYLREIARNPAFVRFIVRDLAPFTLDIAGANLLQARFVLTRGGRKMYEGAAPDRSSRLAIIGELGVAIQLGRGLSTVVFEPDMNWKIMP